MDVIESRRGTLILSYHSQFLCWGPANYETAVSVLSGTPTGGVFEEAIAIANLMLDRGEQIAQTVRTASFVDNTWKVRPGPHHQCAARHAQIRGQVGPSTGGWSGRLWRHGVMQAHPSKAAHVCCRS